MTPDSPAYHLKWSGHTDCGKVRKNNEDSFLGLAVDATGVHHLGKIGEAESGTSDYIFAVSDGMGGAMAGEFASKIAVEKITGLIPRLFRQNASGLEIGFSDVLQELFAEIPGFILLISEIVASTFYLPLEGSNRFRKMTPMSVGSTEMVRLTKGRPKPIRDVTSCKKRWGAVINLSNLKWVPSALNQATDFCFARTASPTAFTTPTSKRSSMPPPRNPHANSSSPQWIIQEGTIQPPSSSRFNALAIEKNQKHTAFCNSPPNCFGPKSSGINHNRPKGDRLPKATPKE